MTHVLETSGLLALQLDEPGAETVEALFIKPGARIGLCVISLLEFELRLISKGHSQDESKEIVDYYRNMVDAIISVDELVCARAVELKLASALRLPSIDSIIAATASIHGAILVHRDNHFLSIPSTLLKQELLTQKNAP